jgi:DNA-binding GntR family transcriptional regulator
MPAMPALETVSTVDALERDLERQVLDGAFAPGEHLREIELAQQYGVARHTIRAAFDGLARKGLLEKARNRGVFVRALTATDLAEIYELRAALEAQAFRALALSGAAPPEAHEALAELRGLSARSPWRHVVRADLAFHRAIVAGAGNDRLARAHEQLEAEVLLCLAQLVHGYASIKELVAQHVELLGSIEGGRPDQAEQAIRRHLDQATEWLMARALHEA